MGYESDKWIYISHAHIQEYPENDNGKSIKIDDLNLGFFKSAPGIIASHRESSPLTSTAGGILRAENVRETLKSVRC